MPRPSRRNQIRKVRVGEAITARMLQDLAAIPFSILGGRGIRVDESSGRMTISLAEPIINPRPSFFGLINANETDGTNRWLYTVDEAILTGAGYSGWAARTSGRQVDARNMAEVGNTASIAGGVDTGGTDYPAGFSAKPVPDGTLVQVWQVMKSDQSATEWWFNYGPTPHDGTCEAPP